MKMCVVTCGPASEPIDQVRRITNFSTGELGVILSEKLVATGNRVICCKGAGATWPDPVGCEVLKFTTNDDLLTILQNLAAKEKVEALFHAAALADFSVEKVTTPAGIALQAGKISSAETKLLIHLVSARKLLPRLRDLFPTANIIAWKYEVDGTRDDALEKGKQQMQENQTDACVANGPGFGAGFAIIESGTAKLFSNKDKVTSHLSLKACG